MDHPNEQAEERRSVYQSIEQHPAEPSPPLRARDLETSSIVRRKPLPRPHGEPDYEAIPTMHPEAEAKLEDNLRQNRPSQSSVWAPGFWKRLPVLSALSLLGAMGCKLTIAGFGALLIAFSQAPPHRL